MSYEDLSRSLQEHLAKQPDDGPEFDLLLRDLLRQDRLPPQIYTLLMGHVQGAHATAESSGTAPSEQPASDSHALPTRIQSTSTAAVEKRRAHVGAVLKDRFVLEEQIGRGGMGIVFKARDLRKEEARDRDPHVAIKVLSEEFERMPEAFVILQREAKRAQSLAHPNIGTVYDFDRDGEIVYMCMELFDGHSLDEIIKRQGLIGLPLKEAQPIIKGMARGLGHAHRSDILHADFKPSNVFVTRNGEVKIFDFGIARAVTAPGRTAQETVFDPAKWEALTPSYASCEMIDGLDADPRDDVYGLACVTYELLAGQHPFGKRPANQARALNLETPAVPGLSRAQNAALAHGLAFNRSDRSSSAAEFVRELTGRARPSRKPAIAGVSLSTAVFIATIAWFWRPESPQPQPPVPDQRRPPVILNAEARSRIETYLNVARAHISVGRLVEPKDGCALDAYNAVLELQPDNAAALSGLQTIAERLEEVAQQRFAAGDLRSALTAVQQGLLAVPNSPALLELQQDIDRQR